MKPAASPANPQDAEVILADGWLMLSKAARSAIEEPLFHMLNSIRLLTMLTVLATPLIASSAEFKLPPHTLQTEAPGE